VFGTGLVSGDKALIKTITKTVDTLVHLGAGRCSELDDYLALQPGQVLLVEADPQLAAALQKRTKDLPQVQVICAAVAGEGGPATLYRFNLPDANSLHAPSGLLEIFPGLKTVERLSIEAVSPVVFLEPLGLKVEQENCLVIDLPGEELPVLQALLRAERLHLFSSIQLHCGRETLYEESEPASRVLHWLKEQGFDVIAENDSLDPDRPSWTLERNTLQLRNRELSRQVQALQEKLQQLTSSYDEQVNHAAQLNDQVRQLTAERDAQAKLVHEQNVRIEQLSNARDEQAKLAGDRHTQVEQLSQAKAAVEKLAVERQQQIAELVQAKEDISKQIAELQSQIQQLTQERDTQANVAGERQALVEQLTQARDQQAKVVAEHQQAIEQITKVRDEQNKLAGERQSQLEQVIKERDEKAKWASSLKAQLEEITQARADAEKLATERQARIEQLSQAKTAADKMAVEQKEQIEQLTKVRDEQTKLATDRQAQIQQLTN
jgi:FkbM family methyltransferase